MVWPEEAGMGAAPARRAKAASFRRRPGCDQLISSWAALDRTDTRLVEQLRSEFGDERMDLVLELLGLVGEDEQSAREHSQGDQRATLLVACVSVEAQPGAPCDQPRLAEHAQLGPERLGADDD